MYGCAAVHSPHWGEALWLPAAALLVRFGRQGSSAVTSSAVCGHDQCRGMCRDHHFVVSVQPTYCAVCLRLCLRLCVAAANKYGKLSADELGTAAQWTLFANSTLSEAFFNERMRCVRGRLACGACGCTRRA